MSDYSHLQHFGTMLDCSRNAVMNLSSVKKWIDITADLGYNTLMLYTEDTYEVEGEPYFGHWRGRYSQEELREMDAYAADKAMELVPCIQTLAHLNALMRWPQYDRISDCHDILLAGDERVYELIERMFETLSKCFRSRLVNIGMDEAAMIGLGRYLEQHGYQNRSEILVTHLARVAKIAATYGFEVIMWGDMFIRLAAGGDYYVDQVEVSEDIKRKIPDNVHLIYWDYYSTDKTHYDRQMKAHTDIKAPAWFAGGIWTWTGFAPHNAYSMRATEAALQSCREQGVRDIVLTLWGDNGAECSKFSALPALFYAAEYVKGNTDLSAIKVKFAEKYGVPFDQFMLLDLPGTANDCPDGITNPDKYLLYNDCFMGVADSTVRDEDAARYSACAHKLAQVSQAGEWTYLFRTMQALCEVLAVKCDLGLRTRAAYLRGNRQEIQTLTADYRALLTKIEHFYACLQTQWMRENKPHGFDVQDLRIGGLLLRVKSCLNRLEQYAQGTLDRIEELEEPVLDVYGAGENLSKRPISYNVWQNIATVNPI